MDRVRVAVIALALGTLCGPALAQGRPTSRPGTKPGANQPAKPPEEQDVHIRAAKQEVLEKGHARATGFVDLRVGDIHVQSDVMDVYETALPDGRKTHRVVAEGNVTFLREEERI